MTIKREGSISLEEAKRAVESVSRRIALLHLSYAKTLIMELGEERGNELITKAIKDYGIRLGKKTKKEVLDKGLETTPENFSAGMSYAIPRFGVHERTETVEVEGEPRIRVYGCVLAKVWQEYGEEKLGRLYCYMDPAKYMAYNPNYKLIHTKTIPDGDDHCELAVRPTTKKERRDFLTKEKDWLYIDKV
ncbi:MAG: L-2-amino-thiazoline-4-carboxylic acid hydrolase [Candidatus Bathyarchaeia archaeon]